MTNLISSSMTAAKAVKPHTDAMCLERPCLLVSACPLVVCARKRPSKLRVLPTKSWPRRWWKGWCMHAQLSPSRPTVRRPMTSFAFERLIWTPVACGSTHRKAALPSATCFAELQGFTQGSVSCVVCGPSVDRAFTLLSGAKVFPSFGCCFLDICRKTAAAGRALQGRQPGRTLITIEPSAPIKG